MKPDLVANVTCPSYACTEWLCRVSSSADDVLQSVAGWQSEPSHAMDFGRSWSDSAEESANAA